MSANNAKALKGIQGIEQSNAFDKLRQKEDTKKKVVEMNDEVSMIVNLYEVMFSVAILSSNRLILLW
jgi:hypothetical protein